MNMLDYLDWRGDLSFEASGPNEVDALIFAWLSYYRFEELGEAEELDGRSIAELAELHVRRRGEFEKLNLANSVLPSASAEWLLRCAAETARFGGVRVRGFQRVADAERGVQFAAVTFLAGDALSAIVYRGTDNSIAGWKEDCYLAFSDAVPAQTLAARYLEGAPDGRATLVCGHSKGGNLALYAALFASEARVGSVDAVYNFDGPGFCFDLKDVERYGRIRKRLHSIVPESSIVGMLLNHEDDFRIVESKMAGILQHDALFWQVQGPRLVSADRRNFSSVIADDALRDWIAGMSLDERREFVDAVFSILESTGAEYTSELPERIMHSDLRALARAASLRPEQRKMVFRLLRELVRAGNASLYESVVHSVAARFSPNRDETRPPEGGAQSGGDPAEA